MDLESILKAYQLSFKSKVYNEENDDHDVLMDAFGITPELKRQNRQYWGRELGKMWERLVVDISSSQPTFEPAKKIGDDEPYDLILDGYAIDAKYRIGSGDSGTLKKFKQYGAMLKEQGYQPLILLLREDNLSAAITACTKGGWLVLTGDQSFEFVKEQTGFDLKEYLENNKNRFSLD